MSAVTEADHLRARLPTFRRKLGHALEEVEQLFARARCPYVAFSGGKDSLVALGLAATVRPGVEAIWCDHELEPPESVAYILGIAEHLPVRLTVAKCYSAHAGWFVPWRDAPFFREPVPGTVDMGNSPRLASMGLGYDGVLLGLRAQEAIYRRMNARRGRVYQVRSFQWHGQPIVGWTVDEVWAGIAALGLPVNPVYEALASAGVERGLQRVGPLPLSPGWILQRTWPGLYRDLTDRYGERW